MKITQFSKDDFGNNGETATPKEQAWALISEPVREKEQLKENGEAGLRSHTQYTKFNENYIACGRTVKKITPGIYNISVSERGDAIFSRTEIKSDEWLTFRDTLIADVLAEIKKFWASNDKFEKYGFLQRRGYMLYGPPGTGKTVLVKQIMQQIVENGGIVILADTSPSNVSLCLQQLNAIEPNRQIVCIYEDIDAIIRNYGESSLLSLLDGEDSTNHILNIATTNYPEKLDKRIIGRPRRFDRIIKIGFPDKAMREYYFQHKLKIEGNELKKWVDATEDFTFAALTEAVISVKCLENSFDETIKNITALLGDKPNSNDGLNKKVGFGI